MAKTNWRNEFKSMEQAYMTVKDQYADLARALGFEGDCWFGDPFATHAEIVKRARELVAMTSWEDRPNA